MGHSLGRLLYGETILFSVVCKHRIVAVTPPEGTTLYWETALHLASPGGWFIKQDWEVAWKLWKWRCSILIWLISNQADKTWTSGAGICCGLKIVLLRVWNNPTRLTVLYLKVKPTPRPRQEGGTSWGCVILAGGARWFTDENRTACENWTQTRGVHLSPFDSQDWRDLVDYLP